MRKILFLIFLSLFFLNQSFATEINIEDRVNYNSQTEKVISILDNYFEKYSENQKEIIINKLILKLKVYLQKDISDSNKYLYQEIIDTYKAQMLFNSSDEKLLVTRIIDGDTIEVEKINGDIFQIRLVGIDTPEKGNCNFDTSKKELEAKILNKEIKFIYDDSQASSDIFGRELGYIFINDGTFINHWMIENGFAKEYTYKTEYLFQSYFQNEENIAEYKYIGNWNRDTLCDTGNNDDIEGQEVETINEIKYNYGFYTSSHYSSHLYYCQNDSSWEGLSENYLEFYENEIDLINRYPYKTLNKSCY